MQTDSDRPQVDRVDFLAGQLDALTLLLDRYEDDILNELRRWGKAGHEGHPIAENMAGLLSTVLTGIQSEFTLVRSKLRAAENRR